MAFVGQPYVATPLLPAQRIVSPSSATPMSVPVGATFAYVTVEGSSVRWLDGGSNPTLTVGHLLDAGEASDVFPGDLATTYFIDTGTTAVITISYYR